MEIPTQPIPIKEVVIVGSGSAGLLAALTFRSKAPNIRVRIVRDPDIPVIGVGEGTTLNFPRLVFDYIGIPRKAFYLLAEPMWKLGIRFKWGPRGAFNYTFSNQFDSRYPDLPRPNGFYCDEDFSAVDDCCALMDEGKVFHRLPTGLPLIHDNFAFHIENEKFVATLEKIARESEVEIIDGRVAEVERGDAGVTSLHLEDGRKLEADLFIDASGFRSELLGQAMGEEFESFRKTLFCDRAVVGGWQRGLEPILPYTTAQQMSHGWSWQIEHEHRINRGYVYASDMISDEDAEGEFRKMNPKVGQTRIVKFTSGTYPRTWVGNVVAIGNSSGFVEPLEATALTKICTQMQLLMEMLLECGMCPSPSVRHLYNRTTYRNWIEIRDFLGLHYKLNTSIDTPFWKRCREDTELGNLQPLLDFYEENGPTGLCRYRLNSKDDAFGIEGHLVMIVGQKYPYRNHHQPTPEEQTAWERHRQESLTKAKNAMDIKEALKFIRHPGWQWHGDARRQAR